MSGLFWFGCGVLTTSTVVAFLDYMRDRAAERTKP